MNKADIRLHCEKRLRSPESASDTLTRNLYKSVLFYVYTSPESFHYYRGYRVNLFSVTNCIVGLTSNPKREK